MSMTAHPVWFKDDSGEWSQINNVIDIVVATPLVARGNYRDNPPVTPAAGGGAITASDGTNAMEASMQIIGGVTPTVTQAATALDDAYVTVSSPSSILQDDNYTHEPLRYVFGPEPIIFFRTADAGSPTLPDDTTFSTDRPLVPAIADLSSGGFFTVFEGDCFFPWTKNCGVRNTPPYGQTVYDPSA
jgi:hypothetical protein